MVTRLHPLLFLLQVGVAAAARRHAGHHSNAGGDAAAAVDELVRLYHLEPHAAAAAIGRQYAPAATGLHQQQELRSAEPPSSSNSSSIRRALQEHPLSARMWDLDVLKDNPCTNDTVPLPAEKIVAVGSDEALAAALLAEFDPQDCSDTLATNAGASQPCVYDCDSLAEHYNLSTSATTCYIRGPTSWPTQLTDQIRTTQDYFDFLPEQLNPTETMVFEVGAGRSCVNVTVETLLFADGDDVASGGGAEVEVRCLLEGTCLLVTCMHSC